MEYNFVFLLNPKGIHFFELFTDIGDRDLNFSILHKKQVFLDGVTPFLKGIAQIMLQNNPWTGLFFLAGICYGSLTMGLAVLIAVTTGTGTAILLKYDKGEINNGLYQT